MTRAFSNACRTIGVMISLALPSATLGDEAVTEYELVLPAWLHAQYEEYTSDFDPFADGPVKEEGLWRHLAESVIFAVAPVIGGCECRVSYRPTEVDPTFVRTVTEIKSGRMLSHPIAAFEKMIDTSDGSVLLSEPVLRADEFYVGFYTNAGRDQILAIDDPEEILNLRYSSVPTWTVDIAVLEGRGFRTVLADDWYTIMQMIKNGRSDIVLQPFASAEDFSTVDEVSGESLAPIPGYKMAFPHARKYVVSSAHPDGESFMQALNAGLQIMRENGLLTEYMTKAGVIDPRIVDFEEL